MAHIVPMKTNLITFASLVILTVFTVLMGKAVDLGPTLNLSLAMLVAVVKAFIVFSWFMHLKYESYYYRFVAISSIFFLLLFVGISAIDVFTRIH